MAEYLIHGETLDAIAEAINQKRGTQYTYTPEDMVTAIGNIQTGGGLPQGMTHIGSGSFTFASRTPLNTEINHGLSFTPRAVIIWTNNTEPLAGEMFYCFLTRELANNTGTTKTSRYFAGKISNTVGIDYSTYSSDDANFFIKSTTFNVGHGSRYYAAGATYYWFAFG